MYNELRALTAYLSVVKGEPFERSFFFQNNNSYFQEISKNIGSKKWKRNKRKKKKRE